MDRLVTPSEFAGACFVAPVPSGKSELLRALAALALVGEGVVLATPPFGHDVTGFIAALGALGAEIVPASDRIVVMKPSIASGPTRGRAHRGGRRAGPLPPRARGDDGGAGHADGRSAPQRAPLRGAGPRPRRPRRVVTGGPGLPLTVRARCAAARCGRSSRTRRASSCRLSCWSARRWRGRSTSC